jgi:thiol-disulfide isomerase/thioredoxin
MVRTRILLAGWFLAIAATVPARASEPTVAGALQLVPIQKDVEYDRPAAADVARCTLKAEKSGQTTGWVVLGPSGEVLRRFLDTNADGVVDTWCYFKDGIEVYRDVDSDYNRKADEYRWLNTAGTRWAIDRAESGAVESWLAISAEEVSREVIAALAHKDEHRFARLLLTAEELASLGLGAAREQELNQKLGGAAAAFRELARTQRAITPQSHWLHFGGSQPGTVPAGIDGSTKDIHVYENVVSIVENGGKHEQIYLGTLIQVGRVWRVIDAPQVLTGRGGELAHSGFFFRAPAPHPPAHAAADAGGVDESMREILAELEKTDKQLAAAAPDRQAALHARRADLIEQLAAKTADPTERGTWLRQMADTVSIAVQSGTYPDGVQRLEQLAARLAEQSAAPELVAYVTFRHLTADYGHSLHQDDADFQKIQASWIENLTRFVTDHPQAEDAAEAMLQLAIAQEFSGKPDEARAWYGKIVQQFPSSPPARKAAGAKRRLDAEGKPLALRGTMLDGRAFDLASLKGRIVLVHYWATWCEPCKEDMKTLRQLLAKYGQQGFIAVGVNVDSDRRLADAYVKQERINWPQLFEAGGLDGRLANELGILTLPTMLLIDADGTVASRSLHISELEAELKKRSARSAKR